MVRYVNLKTMLASQELRRVMSLELECVKIWIQNDFPNHLNVFASQDIPEVAANFPLVISPIRVLMMETVRWIQAVAQFVLANRMILEYGLELIVIYLNQIKI